MSDWGTVPAVNQVEPDPALHLQQGRIIIPKSVTSSRIRENLDVLGFDLADAELAAIDALERDGRTGPHPVEFNGS